MMCTNDDDDDLPLPLLHYDDDDDDGWSPNKKVDPGHLGRSNPRPACLLSVHRLICGAPSPHTRRCVGEKKKTTTKKKKKKRWWLWSW